MKQQRLDVYNAALDQVGVWNLKLCGEYLLYFRTSNSTLREFASLFSIICEIMHPMKHKSQCNVFHTLFIEKH